MNATPNNLPLQLSRFIGRKREIDGVRQLLVPTPAGMGTRLVTLTGAGGSGKTRLALEIASAICKDIPPETLYPDGVWFIDLAPLSDPDLVSQTLATTLDLSEHPGRVIAVALTDHLREKQLLILLDNCEHLIDACAQLVETLLRSCAHVQVLATSREALRVNGETIFPISPLTVPNPGDEYSLEALMQFEAVRLLVDRARAVRPAMVLSGQNAGAVVRICQRLDGMPLALELAAAQVNAFSLTQIAERLDDRFRLLTTGNRTALPRHRTLRAAVEWSHDLLSESEQVLFRRLAVFAGGWTVEAAEAVCSDNGLTNSHVVECLSGLVSKSLIVAEEREGEARYRMLETIREYATERLQVAEETTTFRDHHLRYWAGLAEKADREIDGSIDIARWLDFLEENQDNFRAAFMWCESGGDGSVGLALATSLFWLWEGRTHLREGRDWLRRMLRISADAPKNVRARGLRVAAWMEMNAHDYVAAQAVASEALTLFEALGDRQYAAYTLRTMGFIVRYQDDFETALSLHQQSLAISQAIEDDQGILWGLAAVAEDNCNLGELESARPIFEQCLDMTIRLNKSWQVAGNYRVLGDIAFAQGEYDRALAYYAESSEFQRSFGHWESLITSVRATAQVYLAKGDYEHALAQCLESLELACEKGWPHGIVAGLATMAGIARAQQQSIQAARLLGHVSMLMESQGIRLTTRNSVCETDEPAYHENIAGLRKSLDSADFARAWAEGRGMTTQQAVAEARLVSIKPKDTETPNSPSGLTASTNPAGLSAREGEVLRLLAQGLTNAQIAQQLVISTRTVNAHLRSIYGKLDVTTRTAAARVALEHKLI